MRLASLTLERYGPFDRLTVPLDAAPGRVNLLVAPNGWGKSVVRQAIGDFLFGIPERSAMSFLHGTERMRLAGEVAAGSQVRSLVRRKGRGNTLAEADGAPVPADEARRLFGGADETLFRQLFGLDTALLREGADALLGSQGRLGQVLFAASGGMGRVRALLERLRERRDEFGSALRRHKSRPLWAALNDFEQAQAALNRAALRPDGWRALERAAEAAEAALARLREEQATAASRLRQLRMVQAIRPWVARHAAARRVLETASDVPRIDVGFERRWREARASSVEALGVAQATRAALEATQVAHQAIVVDQDWLAAEPEINALGVLRGRAQGALADLPGLRQERAAAVAAAERLRRDLGWDAGVPVAPAPAVQAALQHLRARPALEATSEAAARDADEARRRVERTRAAMADLPPKADVTALADLVAALRAGGEPVARMEAARRQLRAAESAFHAALVAIPDRPLTEAMLSGTAPPSEAAMEAACNALADAEAEIAAARTQLGRLSGETANAESQLSALTRNSALPEPHALLEARERRDALWANLEPALRGGPSDPGWPLAFERSLREADAIADKLLAHSTEAARAAELRERLTELQEKRARAEEVAAAAEAGLAAARGVLARIAATAGAAADATPSVLRSFLRARLRASECRTARDLAIAEAAETRAQLDGLAARLAAALGMPPAPVEALAPLLAEADRRVQAGHAAAALRERLAAELREGVELRARRMEAAERAGAALAAWSEAWASAAVGVSRPPDEPPDVAEHALGLLGTLRAAEAKRDDAARRVSDLEALTAAFGAEVSALAARLAPELTGLAPMEAMAGLERQSRAEAASASRKRALEAQALAAAEAAERAAAAQANADAALAACRAALLAADDEAAERQLVRAREVAEAGVRLAEAETQLATLGGGRDNSTLAELTAAMGPDDEALAIDRLEVLQNELAPQIEAAVTERDRALEARDRAAGSIEAADAATRRAGAQAALARNTEEALVLHAAATLLAAALERQAAAADQPLLARIGAAFRTITAGAHAGVAIEADGAGQAMVALGADGSSRKPLDQLSEGTRDQLYLALRIAALEDYAALAPPLPFIADDVLQTFDDTRTIAALGALRDLSEHVQVIALTHHPHVAALTEALPAGTVNLVSLAAA